MEYKIQCKNRAFLLVCENADLEEKEETIFFKSPLEKSVTFDLFIESSNVRVDDEELIIFDGKEDYLSISSPIVICNEEKKDALFNVSLNEGRLHFYLKCDEADYNESNYVVTEIKRVKVLEEKEVETTSIIEKDVDPIYDFETKERIVRKKVARFIEKLLEYAGYRVDYSNYKSLIYREKECDDEYEMEIKNIYDAYVYLITDYKNIMSEFRLKRFFYILLGREIDENIVLRIVDAAFTNREVAYSTRAASLLKLGLELFGKSGDKKEMMIPFMLMNSELIRSGIPATMILYRDYQYFKSLDLEDDLALGEFVERIVQHNTYQEKKYYIGLTDIDYQLIKETILKDEEMLKNNYHIEHISTFGSLAKGKQRIDSDIDLAVTFSLDATSTKVDEGINYIKNRYFDLFHRYIDVMRLFENGTDERRLLVRFAKEIF